MCGRELEHRRHVRAAPAPVTPCQTATTAEFQRVSSGTLVGFDANGQRIEQDLDNRQRPSPAAGPVGVRGGRYDLADAKPQRERQRTPFYINVNGSVRAAGVLIRAVEPTGECAPGARFTRIDSVRDSALALIHGVDGFDRVDNR